MRRFPFSVPGSPFTLLLLSCATPLTNRIAVGEEAFVVGVGEGRDGVTDLWAASAAGGTFYRLSFNRLVERGPRLSPDGRMLAFFRRPPGSEAWSVVLLGLENGAERSLALPAEAGAPEQVGWGPDGSGLAVRAGGGWWTSPAPPAPALLTRAPGAPLSWMEDAVAERLGRQGEGRVAACGAALCVAAGGGITPLAEGARAGFRWGADSVGYFLGGGDAVEVRPLRGGRARRPAWSGRPAALRELTHHPGQLRGGGDSTRR